MLSDNTVISIAILGIIIFLLYHKPLIENWEINQNNTTHIPINPKYYKINQYRNPFRFPICAHTEHPYPHCHPLDR
jgi:hypothetical protein